MQNVVERTLNLLIFLLEAPHPVTADEVRQTVMGYGDQTDDAFHRMFERDKDVLRKLGVPLKREALDAWEVDFGYTVDPDEYAIPDPKLTQEERVALSVAARIVRLGGSHAGIEALRKLGGVERGVGLEPLGADLGPEAEMLGVLFGAVTDRRSIEFKYRGQIRNGNPFGIAHRRGHWYLVAGTSRGERLYRVDRIETIEVGEEADSFSKPRGFDIRTVMDTHPWETGQDDVVEADVRFDSDVAWWAARTLRLPTPDGDLTVTVPVANSDAFVGWILSFGSGAVVTGPESMRDEIASRVEAALERLP